MEGEGEVGTDPESWFLFHETVVVVVVVEVVVGKRLPVAAA